MTSGESLVEKTAISPIIVPRPRFQFRLKTMLWVTAGIAFLSAIAGPFLRDAKIEISYPGKAAAVMGVYLGGILLGFAVITSMDWLYNWYDRAPKKMLTMRYGLLVRPKRGGFVVGIMQLLFFSYWVVVVIVPKSFELLDDSQKIPELWYCLRDAAGNALLFGVLGSYLTNAYLAMRSTRFWLGENGLGGNNATDLIPWKYIHTAWRIPESPGTIRLKRMMDTLDIETPPELSAEIEAFLRTKTTWQDTPPLAATR